jgi:hypothetical protein
MKQPYLSLLSVLFIINLACNLAIPSSFNQPSQPPGATPTPVSSPAIEPTQPGYSLGLTSVGDNLAQLESYRTALTVDFNGTQGGQSSSGRIETLTEVNQKSSALHYVLTVDAAIPQLDAVAGRSELFQVNHQIYITRAGETIWFEAQTQRFAPDDFGFLEPAQLIVLPASVSTPPQPETLNGLPALRYHFSQADLNSSALIFNQAQGDVWLAQPGNYVVQYMLSAELQMVAPLPNAHILDEGSLNLRYTLTNANTDFTILPPGAAVKVDAGSLADLPRLPDAEITSVFPGLVEYTSASSPLSATLFYRDELASRGWQENSSDIFTEKARLTFSKTGQTLTIIITPAGEPDKIKILLDLKSP